MLSTLQNNLTSYGEILIKFKKCQHEHMNLVVSQITVLMKEFKIFFYYYIHKQYWRSLTLVEVCTRQVLLVFNVFYKPFSQKSISRW